MELVGVVWLAESFQHGSLTSVLYRPIDYSVSGFTVIKNRCYVLEWVIAADALWFSGQRHNGIDKTGQRWFTSRTLLRTISQTNQDMSGESECDPRGYHGINQLIQGGGAIYTAGHTYKPSKWLWKGLNLTCNLTGQRASAKERVRARQGRRIGEVARVMEMLGSQHHMVYSNMGWFSVCVRQRQCKVNFKFVCMACQDCVLMKLLLQLQAMFTFTWQGPLVDVEVITPVLHQESKATVSWLLLTHCSLSIRNVSLNNVCDFVANNVLYCYLDKRNTNIYPQQVERVFKPFTLRRAPFETHISLIGMLKVILIQTYKGKISMILWPIRNLLTDLKSVWYYLV